MRKPRKLPPLSKEKLREVPYGDHRCRICQMDIQDLQKFHALKLEKNLTIRQLRDCLKNEFKAGSPRLNQICKHFQEHLLNNTMVNIGKNPENKEVAMVLTDMSMSQKVKTNEDIEKAYSRITKMTEIFTSRMSLVLDKIEESFKTNAKKLDDEINKTSPLLLLKRVSELLAEAREQVKEVSALRAPKVMVSQFLESAINNIIKDVSDVLNMTCGMLQTNITDELVKSGRVDNQTFVKVFQEIALSYKERMLSLKRETMSKALTALSEMEKII